MTSFADPGSVQQSSGEDSRDVQVNLNADVSGYTTQVGAAQAATAGLVGAVDKLSLSLSGLTKFAGRQMFHFAAADFAGLTAAVADAASLEHQLGTLRATAAITGTSMGAMSTAMDKAFAGLPVARSQLIGLTTAVSKMGVAPLAAPAAARTYTKLGAATGEDPTALAGGSTQLNRMMGNTQTGQIDKYANALATLAVNNRVAATSILEFSQSIAPMARAAGIGEAAIMGIATVFTKAGADGGYAANTFNKIVTEIQTMKETGDPNIAKYASFTGNTVQGFRQQDTTTSAIQLFDQIGKGGPQSLNFMSSLGLGPRDLKAAQAVAQQGGLGAAVAEARAGVGNTDNLDKGAKAAFSGLTNSMTELGTQFTKLGELIGGPLLGPLTLLAKGLNAVMGLINKVVSSLGPIPGIVATIAGALAVAGGVALTHFGLLSTLAIGRAINRGTTVTAYRQGVGTGGLIRGGMAPDAAMARSAVGQRFVAGTATSGERRAYNYGLNRGALAGPGLGSRLGGVFGTGWRGVAGAGTWAANMMGINKAGQTSPTLVQSMQTGSVGGLVGAGGRMVTSNILTGTAAVGALTGRAASLAAAGIVPAGVRIATATAARTVAPVAAAVAPAAAVAGGALRAGAGALGGLLLNPWTMLAGMIALPIVGAISSSIKERDAKRADFSAALTGSSVYDQGLDRASTNLGHFGDSLDAAADRLSKFANTPLADVSTVTPEDIAAAQNGKYKVDDPKLESISRQAAAAGAKPGADPKLEEKALGAYLDEQAIEVGGPIKGDAATKYKQDILALHPGQNDMVTRVMKAFSDRQDSGKRNTPDYGLLAGLAGGTPDTDAGFEDYKNIQGSAATSIDAGTTGQGAAGTRIKLGNTLSSGIKSVGSAAEGQGQRIEGLNQVLADSFKGIDRDKLARAEYDASQDLHTRVPPTEATDGKPARPGAPFGTEADAAKVVARALAMTAPDLMKANGLTEAGLLKIIQNPEKLPQPATATDTVTLKDKGPLGRWAANNADFMAAATGNESGKAGAQFAASIKLANEAAKEAGGDFGVASTNLTGLAGAVGGATGALISSAAAWLDTMNSFRLPTLSRAQQFAEVTATSARDMAAGQLTDATPEARARGEAALHAKGNLDETQRQTGISQIKEITAANTAHERAEAANTLQRQHSNRDFNIQQGRAEEEYGRSRLHSIEDFATSQARAAQSYYLSVRHSQEDFATSQLRAEQDYHRASARAQEDYQLQAQRSQEDYQKNVDRQTADHLRDLRRQGEAAAQSIYDPFTRVQVKATTDAGTLIYNLKEQNADIARQMKEIKELRDKGVSQQTIDTLQLGSAENAQQVTALNSSLDQNPNMVGQINSQVAARVKSATALTQNPGNNVTFRQSEEDFSTSMSRASEDFSKTQKRGAEDHGKTMSRMSEDFKTSSERAASDQGKSLARMSEAFSIQQAQAAEDQEKALARMDEAFSISQKNAVDDHAKALSDMAAAYKLTQKQAAEDLATSMKEYTGNLATVMAELVALALGELKGWAPKASAIIAGATKAIQAAMPTPLQGILTGGTGTSPVGHLGPNLGIPQGPYKPPALPVLSPAPAAAPKPPQGMYAFGGISLTQQRALVSEHGPEAHIPLNSHGENFMAALIARSLAQGVTTATSGGPVGSTSVNTDNSISFAGADIQVVAQDPNAMAQQLFAKAKLARLASPVRH